jgi:DNA-binding LytR/AlgR family response regulator
LAREARARFPRLKVLFTSGYTKHALVHRGRLDENVDIITKPYRKANLAKKLSEVFDGHIEP